MHFSELDDNEQRKLLEAPYISLQTYRRDGRAVATPVWAALDGGELWTFSNSSAGKVKRVKGRERSDIARCDARGGSQGPRIETRARIVESPAELDHAYAALRRRYGWQMKLTDFFSTLSGRIRRRTVIALRPVEADGFSVTGEDRV